MKFFILKCLNGLFLAFMLTVLFISCRNEKVDEAVKEFMDSRIFNRSSYSYSKTLDELSCYYFSDYSLHDVEEKGDSLFKVNVKLGSASRDISILVEKDTIESYKVIYCWGLVNFTEELTLDSWDFALRTGCVSEKENLSDLEIYDRMRIAGVIQYSFYKSIYDELNHKVEVTKQNWDRGYGNYASGSAIIYNGSSYTMPKLKYKIEYSDIKGHVITEDRGTASYEPFSPGEYKSFSFYTPNVGNSSYAWIRPVIDEEWVWKLSYKKTCTGSEFVDYVEKYGVKLFECAWK